jgi:hypothetical protein
MAQPDLISEWNNATSKARASIFEALDRSSQLKVAQNVSTTEGGRILNEMERLECQLLFLSCMKLSQGISTLANATAETRRAIVKAMPRPLQETVHNGIEAKAIVQEVKSPGPKNRLKPIKIIVYTDVERDIDDAVLLIILAYLHKTGVAEVLLVVTNVKPSKSRAKRAKFIFEEIGAPGVPVAYGTDGTDEDLVLHHYEFEGLGEPEGTILDGNVAVVNTLKALESKGEYCSMIVIASLRDLSKLIEEHESLVKNTVSSIFFQGAWEVDQELMTVNTLVPDMTVVNNEYDCEATTNVYNWLRQSTISTYTATRHSAFMAPISSHVFQEAADRGNLVASYIYNAFGEQERKFYNQAAEEDPEKRFRPHLNKKWYASRCRRWCEAYEDKLPETFEEIQPYIDMTLYDVVAGLICPLREYNFIEKIYQPYQQSISIGDERVNHHVIGRLVEGPKKVEPDINPGLLSNVIVELLKEGLEIDESN